MDLVIPINLVCILFDPAIPTSSFNLFNCFYTCNNMYSATETFGLIPMHTAFQCHMLKKIVEELVNTLHHL